MLKAPVAISATAEFEGGGVTIRLTYDQDMDTSVPPAGNPTCMVIKENGSPLFWAYYSTIWNSSRVMNIYSPVGFNPGSVYTIQQVQEYNLIKDSLFSVLATVSPVITCVNV